MVRAGRAGPDTALEVHAGIGHNPAARIGALRPIVAM